MSSSAPPRNRSTLVTAVSLAVGILGVFGALNSYQVSVGNAQQYPDVYGGSRAEARFAPLISRVAADAEVGYLTDLDPSAPAYGSAYLAAQYALAPRVLLFIDDRTRPEWAVGNFSKPMDFAAAGAARGYTLAQDFGTGVILFHRVP